MIRKIVITILCFIAVEAYAQEGTASPYSLFGVGELSSVRTAENQMMGGIGIYADSIHANLNNPAAYSKLGIKAGEDFGITVYTAGVSFKQLTLKNVTSQESTSVTNLDYLSIALSLKEGLGVGIGITPYSSLGYSIVSETTNDRGGTVTNFFDGTGGLTRVYFSTGYEIVKNLSIGATLNFNFGTLENNRLQVDEDVQFGIQDNRQSRVNGFDFNYALNYTPKINDKYRLHSSIRVNTQGNLTARNTRDVGSISNLTGQDIESRDVDLTSQGLVNTDLRIPTTSTIGLGIGQDLKWFIGAEYSQQGLSSFTNDFFELDNVVYEDASTIAFGGFYVPNYSSFSSYLSRVTYRAGARFEKTGIIVNDTSIDNFGITFGVGLPLSGSFSNVNLGFEYGQRGTTDANLIEENYFKVNLGLSLNDLWFRKRKIN